MIPKCDFFLTPELGLSKKREARFVKELSNLCSIEEHKTQTHVLSKQTKILEN
jgi:hypothetical protein